MIQIYWLSNLRTHSSPTITKELNAVWGRKISFIIRRIIVKCSSMFTKGNVGLASIYTGGGGGGGGGGEEDGFFLKSQFNISFYVTGMRNRTFVPINTSRGVYSSMNFDSLLPPSFQIWFFSPYLYYISLKGLYLIVILWHSIFVPSPR